MSDGNTTPAGWYPSQGGERYWDGNAWTDHVRPTQPPSATWTPPQQSYYQQPQPQNSHAVRYVLLALALVMVLLVGGCFAVLGLAADSFEKVIKDAGKKATPTTVAAGKAFNHDGFAVDAGWKVVSAEYGGATIENISVTLKDDQDASGGGRSARLTFRLYDDKTVVSEIRCSSNEMQEGESSKMRCNSLGNEDLGTYDTIKVSDSW